MYGQQVESSARVRTRSVKSDLPSRAATMQWRQRLSGRIFRSQSTERATSCKERAAIQRSASLRCDGTYRVTLNTPPSVVPCSRRKRSVCQTTVKIDGFMELHNQTDQQSASIPKVFFWVGWSARIPYRCLISPWNIAFG